MPEPVTPTRIIPADAHLPAAPAAPPLPPHPPGPGDIPPWRTPEPPAAPPPPPPAIEVHHTHTHILIAADEPEPEPESRWIRLWNWITSIAAPWKVSAALIGAVFPMPWTGYSAASTWAYTLSEAREMNVGFAYGLGGAVLLLAGQRFRRSHGLFALWAVAVAGVGSIGAISLFDPVTALTGVHR
ncbi:hypothetical protein AB0E27_20115 [Streptomyces sparsogenes]|uniref:hypothetical protein n=1 Tax=Streptomyces sparsogenes TaxID=67365 RepID=UPI0033FD8283